MTSQIGANSFNMYLIIFSILNTWIAVKLANYDQLNQITNVIFSLMCKRLLSNNQQLFTLGFISYLYKYNYFKRISSIIVTILLKTTNTQYNNKTIIKQHIFVVIGYLNIISKTLMKNKKINYHTHISIICLKNTKNKNKDKDKKQCKIIVASIIIYITCKCATTQIIKNYEKCQQISNENNHIISSIDKENNNT